MSEKTRKVILIIRIVILVVIAFEIIRRFATGQSTPHLIFILLLLMVPFKLFNNNATRKQFESTGRGDEWKKIVIKSIIQAILIVTVLVVASVVYFVYFE